MTAASIHFQLRGTMDNILIIMSKFTVKGTLLYMYSGAVLLGYHCYNSDCVKM